MNSERICEERAYAKVNLFLEVRGRREDGFHELETLFHEIDLYDRVRVERTGSGVSLSCDRPDIPVDESNLAMKALRALESRVGQELPCRIDLAKRIPAGGGLGGGSSNAAAVLRALNSLYDLRLETSELESCAAEFGSDTSFFVRGATAWATGRGERFEERIELTRPLWFALCFPGLSVPTGSVFGALDLTTGEKSSYSLRSWCRAGGDAEALASLIFNRLEAPARQLHPRLGELIDRFAPLHLRLSGSGATLFAVTADRAAADAAAREMHEATGCETVVCKSAVRA